MAKEGWIDKTKQMPEFKRAIECRDKDGDILCGIGNRDLFRRDLKDPYILKWRYKTPNK